MQSTPLYQQHEALGARFTEFGGWTMPVQYSSIIEEHHTVRFRAGLFDLSHMGEVAVQGPQALEVVQQLITNDASRLRDGQVLYTPVCLPSGGILDDILVYRLGKESFLLVVNAANTAKDWQWIREVNSGRAVLENQSAATGLLALQGPKSADVLAELTPFDLDLLYYYECVQTDVAGVTILLSRTGYTGEDGFEIYVPVEKLQRLWHAIYEVLVRNQGLPVGLGARDTLRLEMGYALYGNELSESITPLEAGLAWTVAFHKPSFIGHEKLRQQAVAGVMRRLTGFEMVERGIARSHYPVYIGEKRVGEVTSGAPSPSLDKNIGMAYLPVSYRQPGNELEVEIHRRRRKATVVKIPFHPSSVRRRSHAI